MPAIRAGGFILSCVPPRPLAALGFAIRRGFPAFLARLTCLKTAKIIPGLSTFFPNSTVIKLVLVSQFYIFVIAVKILLPK